MNIEKGVTRTEYYAGAFKKDDKVKVITPKGEERGKVVEVRNGTAFYDYLVELESGEKWPCDEDELEAA